MEWSDDDDGEIEGEEEKYSNIHTYIYIGMLFAFFFLLKCTYDDGYGIKVNDVYFLNVGTRYIWKWLLFISINKM